MQATEAKPIQHTGLLQYRQCATHDVIAEGYLPQLEERMRFAMGQQVLQCLSDGRTYMVRVGNVEKHEPAPGSDEYLAAFRRDFAEYRISATVLLAKWTSCKVGESCSLFGFGLEAWPCDGLRNGIRHTVMCGDERWEFEFQGGVWTRIA